MVDPDPGYRPRRAAPSAADDEPTAGPAASGVEAAGPTPAGTSAAGDAAVGGAPTAGAAAGSSPLADPEAAKPLFRDETPVPVARSGAAGDAAASGEETRVVRPLNFRQRRPAPVDEDATTVLPRTGPGARPASGDEDDDERPRRRLLGPRGRLALGISALAAVVVVGLAIIYAVSTVGDPSAAPTSSTATGAPTAGGPASSAGVPSVLGDESLLTPQAAAAISAGRPWTVALTQRGASEDGPVPACLADEPADGEPTAQQQVVRLLSSGAKGPSALHRAAAYDTPEDAAQAYAVAAKDLGGCAVAGSYIASGAALSGLGDQATGLVVDVAGAGTTRWHTVVLSRTGRVVNVVDAAYASRAIAVGKVAAALAAVTTAQCPSAGGDCGATPVVRLGPPPLGGDVPGFLATGDLPPAGKGAEGWVATPAEAPGKNFFGSQCETVSWDRTGAESASSRVYLVPSSTTFGLNDIVLTMGSEKAATDFVAGIRSDLLSCSKRQLTASVSKPAPVTGIGAAGATVKGYTATVAQKSVDGTKRYRVGIVSSGTKVAYTFMNPLAGGYDLSAAEWDGVTVRAGQRMTQVP